MDTLVSYLIRSALVSGLMLGYYHLALRNRKSHSFNRAWLLTTLLASLVLPLLHIGWLTWYSKAQKVVVLNTGSGRNATGVTVSAAAVVVAGCAAISIVLLVILGLRIYRIYKLKRSRPRQWLGGCMLIEVRDRRAPFSFLRNLFWQEGADIQDPVQRRILDHELAHIHGGHTYDNLFAQTLAAIFWMNPLYWLIRRELQMVHEFIADDASVAAGDTGTFALMLLRAYDDGRYLDPSHHFIHSPIKRRLRMISSSKPPSGLWKALALPVLLAGVVLACTKEQSAPALKLATIVPDNQIKEIKFKAMKLHLDTLTVRALNQDGTTKQFRFVAPRVMSDGAKMAVDTLAQKQAEEIRIIGKEPPPPPPQIPVKD